ncbi:uncharacterized protein LOC135835767 isoform X2 [Planococcus citri]|uniref:uncharacterized protein LOC135835767 isoform X2 n=1 Tax=Planococcus citri TaxID=170843 RepID=UPI0031FA11EA
MVYSDFSGFDLFSYSSTGNETISLSNVKEINSMLKKIMIYFKNSNASTTSLPIPDPFHRPDHEYGAIKTTNVTVWGFSNLKINNLTSDLVAMKISFDLYLPKLVETGRYLCCGHLFQRSGKFSLNIKNAHWHCHGALKITDSGRLAVSKIELDLKHRDEIKPYVEDAGLISILVNNFGDVIFESIKSYILSVINANIENYANEQLKHMKIMLPNSIPPIDTFTIEARKFVKKSLNDPYPISDFLYTSDVLLVEVSQIYINGISSFYRTGNINVSLENNNALRVILNFGTGQLKGDCLWEIGILGLYSKYGSAFFDVDYVNVFLNVKQSLDLSKAPVITDMNVKVGNIQLILNGGSLFEYSVEFAVNLISNWLRNQIVKLFKTEIIVEVQEMVNKINMEDIIFKYLISERPMAPK